MSRRRTNAPNPMDVSIPGANRAVLTDPSIQVIQNLRVGVVWANELGKALNKTDCADWDKRKMTIAALTYAAAMASETQLDEADWMELAVTSFRGVVVE